MEASVVIFALVVFCFVVYIVSTTISLKRQRNRDPNKAYGSDAADVVTYAASHSYSDSSSGCDGGGDCGD